MNATSRYTRRQQVEQEPSAALPPTLDMLMTLPHVEQLSFPAERVLLYEGHVAPGIFVFWDGHLLLQSALFEERRTVKLHRGGQEIALSELPDLKHGSASADGSDLTLHQWWVFPERQQLPLALPFTLSTLQTTHALFLPRSLTTEPTVCEILQKL